MNEWYFPSGTLRRDGWDVVVDRRVDGWRHTGLRVGSLGGPGALPVAADDMERAVIPLSGDVLVVIGGDEPVALAPRDDPFAGPCDALYVPAGTGLEIRGSGRVAVLEAWVAEPDEGSAAQLVAAAQVPVELRGGGRASRQIHSFAYPGVMSARRLIGCEVITPAGNWSGYPPHKHDVDVPGHESALEEIYYYEFRATAEGAVVPPEADPHGVMRVRASDHRPIDVLTEVRAGDVVLVPHGWHGPAMAPPGYDMYYLNVMAGPGSVREWRVTDVPAHAWVRDQWPEAGMDPRLPLHQPR